MQGAFLVTLTLLIPAVSALAALFFKKPESRKIFVSVVSVALIAAAVALGVDVLKNGPILLKTEEFSWVGGVVTLIDAVTLIAILYFGIRMREWKVIVPSVLQAAAVVYLEVIKRPREPELLVNLDNLSLVMVLIASVIGPLVAIFALGYMERHEAHHKGKSRQHIFFSVIFLFLTAMNVISISDNFMHLYAFWEITTLCSFLLIGYDKNRKSFLSAKRALWLNSVGGLFFVAGIIFIVNMSGSLSISDLVSGGAVSGYLAAGVLLICCAGFVKSAQLPFQPWLLGAMVAPTPVSALLHSSTMVKAGVYIIVRLSPVFGGHMTGYLVAVVGAFTFMAASALAIGQSNGKRVLAYSTIANLGLIIACAGLGGAEALSAAIFLMIYHAVSKGLMFLCVGTVELGIGSRDIEDMFGLYTKMPFTTVIMVIGMISMMLPPFGVLITKWLALEAAVRVPPVLVLIVLGSAFTIVFWAKWLGAVLTVYKPKKKGIENLPLSMKISLGVIAGIIPILTALISVLNTAIVAPAVTSLLKQSTALLSRPGGFLVTSGAGITGGFDGVLILLGVICGIMLLLFVYSHFGKVRMVTPYAGGENVAADKKGRDFIGPMDKTEQVKLHNYYMISFFSEHKLSTVASLISALLILIMFGVS